MQIKVPNWKDYVRSDIKHPTWFSFPLEFFEKPKYMGKITPDVLAAFAYIVGASVREKGSFALTEIHLTSFTGFTMQRFEAAVEILETFELVTVTRSEPVREPNVARPGAERDTNASRPLQVLQVHKTGTCATEPAVPEVQQLDLQKPEVPEVEERKDLDYEHETVTVPEAERPLPKLALLWNQHAAESFARVKLCTGGRRRHVNNRWKEHPSEEFWSDIIWRINRSDFCTGKGKTGWKATFDWLIKPDTCAKVLEGTYDNRGGPGGVSPSTPSFWARQQGGSS